MYSNNLAGSPRSSPTSVYTDQGTINTSHMEAEFWSDKYSHYKAAAW